MKDLEEYKTAVNWLENEIKCPLDNDGLLDSIRESEDENEELIVNRRRRFRRSNRKPDDDYLDAVYNHSDEDDAESRRVFFNPSLQTQRNEFAISVMKQFGDNLNKVCIMGCGEMSLEKEFICSDVNIRQILSVDIDPTALAKGRKNISHVLDKHKKSIEQSKGSPMLIKSFEGDIVEPDERFLNADCIISLEVVEHMEMEKAKSFIRNVLDNLKPRLFLFSTPNNDYNQVFGNAKGFRHYDHKFELSIKQFEKWVEVMRKNFKHYTIHDPYYIGNIAGNEHLRGATQAIIALLKPTNGELDNSLSITKSYSSVFQTYCLYGIKNYIESCIQNAFVEWLKNNELHERDLVKCRFDSYWNIDIKDILKYTTFPEKLVFISEKSALEILCQTTNTPLYSDVLDGRPVLAIPSQVSKEKILNSLVFS